MGDNVITLQELIRELKLNKFNDNEFLFFQKLIDVIFQLTENKKIYRNGIVYFGKKPCIINNSNMVLHFLNGKFDHLVYVDGDGGTQTFTKRSFESLN